MDYKVVDNFLPKEVFNGIKSLLDNDSFPWFMSESISAPGDDSDYYFIHTFYVNYGVNSKFWDCIVPFLDQINFKAFIRVRGILYPSGKTINNHGTHTDYEHSHKGAILYLNTNDGYTRLNNDVCVESVENRVLFFDPSMPHNSTNCTNAKYRALITANYF